MFNATRPPPSPILRQLRKYEDYLVAEVTFKRPPTMKEVSSGGFRKVAGYIFGKNRVRGRGAASQKMAMTAPVRMELKGGNEALEEVKLSFVMGGNYTEKTLPIPDDSDVKIKKVPAQYIAAVAFNGPPPKEEKVAQKRKAVLARLAQSSALGKAPEPSVETLVYGYHDPFITPNFLRKNEVGVVVS